MDAPPRYRRSVIIAACGIVLAVISLIVLAVFLRTVTPKSLSLAYRISAADTVLFLRTSDADVLREIATRYEDDLGELPIRISYELAILQPPEGQIEWIIEMQKENGERTAFGTKDPRVLLLTAKNIGRSVGQSSFFRQQLSADAANAAYADLSRFSPLPGEAGTLLSAAADPFSRAIVTWKEGSAYLALEKKNKVLFPESAPPLLLPDLSRETSLRVAASDPETIVAAFAKSLAAKDPGLATGLQGVLQSALSDMTHRTDLEGFRAELLSEPAGLAVTEKEGSVFWTKAKNPETAAAWVSALRSAMTPAVIRRQTFYTENSRTDVKAETAIFEREWNGWTLSNVGASGSKLHLIAARKGKELAIATEEPILLSVLDTLDHPPSTTPTVRAFAGSADTQWLLVALDRDLPFLAPAAREILGLFHAGSRISWQASDEASTVSVQLTTGQR